MTSRERQARCFTHQETDRPAVYTRTGYPRNDPTYDRLRAYMEEKSDLRLSFYAGRMRVGLPESTYTERIDDETNRIVRILHTPKGDIRETVLDKPLAKTHYQESYFIKTREDAERYLSLPMPEPVREAEEFFARDREIGDRGIVLVELGIVPGGRIAELCGPETIGIMSIDDRDILHEICRREQRITLNVIEAMLSLGVGPYFSILGEEYILPPLHGPKDFRDFIVRYDAAIINRIHEAGGRVHMHSHGPVGKMLDQFIELGPDVLHPIEPPPMGDVTASQAKQAFGGKICIEGNIQIAHMYEHGPEAIRQETEQLIHDAFYDHKGLIVCPTASPYIPGEGEKAFAQYEAMVETVLTWKG